MTHHEMDTRDAYRELRRERKLRNAARWMINALAGALAVWLLVALDRIW